MKDPKIPVFLDELQPSFIFQYLPSIVVPQIFHDAVLSPFNVASPLLFTECAFHRIESTQ